MEDTNGETQASRSSSQAAHPVYVGTPTASEHSMKDASGETPRSRSGSKPAHPVLARTPPSADSQRSQEKRSPSETSTLFRNILSSPSTPSSSSAAEATRPVSAGTVAFANAQRPQGMHSAEPSTPTSSVQATQAVSHVTPPSISAQPVLGSSVAPSPRPALPNVYGLPKERGEEYTLIHMMVGALPATNGQSLAPRQDSHIAFAVPSSEIPLYLNLASRLNPELKDLTKENPVARSIVHEHRLTYNPVLDALNQSSLLKRKRDDEEGTPKAVANHKEAAKIVGNVMRQAFGKMAHERKQKALIESGFLDQELEIDEYEVKPLRPLGPTKNPYTEEEVADTQERRFHGLFPDLQDQDQDQGQDQAESQARVQEEQVPETPRARGWGFSSMLPSVSRFMAFSSRRAPSTARTASLVAPAPQAPAAGPVVSQPPSNQDLIDSQNPSPSQRGAVTEPRQRNNVTTSLRNGPGTSLALAKRLRSEKPQRILLTKQQAEERRQLKSDLADLRAEKERLAQEKARIAQEKKDWEEQQAKAAKDMEEQQARATAAQTPGTKRKRLPSPDTYPLPAHGFGLVDEIFDYSSSEESSEEEQVQDTPTRPRPNKKARLSSGKLDINVDRVAASQYEGGLFAGAGASSEGAYSNVFGSSTNTGVRTVTTTPSAHSNAFKVPSPTDSEFDEEEAEEGNDDTTSGEASTGSQATVPKSLPAFQQAPPTQTTATSPSKSMPPPPTPNPIHATLPAPKAPATMDPVEKAREKALMHKPKHASRLRESSRLSSSTVGSEAGVQQTEEEAQIDDSEYDPKRPAILQQSSPSFQAESESSDYHAEAKTIAVFQPFRGPGDGMEWSYDIYHKTMGPRIVDHLEDEWCDAGDMELCEVGEKQFNASLEAWKQEQGSEEEDDAAANNISVTSEFGQLSYERANIDEKVRALIGTKVTKEDEDAACDEFDEAFETFQAIELQKQGALTPSITA